MNDLRNFSALDNLCLTFDAALRALTDNQKTTGRPYPGIGIKETKLSMNERKHAAGLMRVNHAGEVSAQALYHGQALASKNQSLKLKMQHAAMEEGDHLYWCHRRLMELGSHTSYLNPFWYAGSLTIGLTAGLIGDRWSLGFLAETEQQVVKHLENHLSRLPKNDIKSHNILTQMQQDEGKHRDEARKLGAAELPPIIKYIMRFLSKVMVKTAYWI